MRMYTNPIISHPQKTHSYQPLSYDYYMMVKRNLTDDFFSFRHGFSMFPRLSWNSICRSDWPRTQHIFIISMAIWFFLVDISPRQLVTHFFNRFGLFSYFVQSSSSQSLWIVTSLGVTFQIPLLSNIYIIIHNNSNITIMKQQQK